MNRKTLTAAISGLIVIVATLLAFFIATGERDTIHWLCLFFIILAELILACGVIGVQNFSPPVAGKALRAGAYTVLVLYSAASVSLAILFLNRFPDDVKWFITIQVSLMTLAAIVLILLFLSKIPESEKETAARAAASRLRQLEETVARLKTQAGNGSFAAELGTVYHAVRACETAATVPWVEVLARRIGELEAALQAEPGDRERRVRSAVEEIRRLTEERAAGKRTKGAL